jgi:hypothetical protein
MELETEHPGVKQSMLKALANVAPRHLLDTRLNPPAELRARAASSSDSNPQNVQENSDAESGQRSGSTLRVYRPGSHELQL